MRKPNKRRNADAPLLRAVGGACIGGKMTYQMTLYLATVALLCASSFAQISATVPPFDPNAALERAEAAFEAGRYPAAIPDLEVLKKYDPADPLIRSKLIVAYEETANPAKRDKELAELRKLHAVSTNEAFRSQGGFHRDTFRVGTNTINVLEYFDLVGDRPIRYSFLISTTTVDSPDTRRITLGSYEIDTRYAREAGKIGPNERMFTLDETTRQGHYTWNMYRGQPSYENLKREIIEILKGQRKPVSSSLRQQK